MKKPIIINKLIIIALSILLGLCTSCSNKIEVSSNPIASTLKNDKPVLNVYIENSGSMDGYMSNGSELKDCIYDYISDLSRFTRETNLNYINSTIIPYDGDLLTYIKTLNPESFKMAGGNRSNTNIGQVIGDVLANVSDTSVCILVSDFILDVPSNDSQNFLIHNEITIKEKVIEARKRVPTLGVEILKLSSRFNGIYFYPDGKVENLTDVKRPYYFWIFGDKDYLAKLNSDVPLSQLDRYDLTGIATFTTSSAVPFIITNQSGTSPVIVPTNGDYHVMIKADFRATLQPEDVIQETSNFSFNNDRVKVDGVCPISDKKESYTHFIKFTIPKGTQIAQEMLTFSAPKMPSWITESNDNTGTNVLENLNKTTGIKYLTQGVADAFRDETICTTLQFNIKRK